MSVVHQKKQAFFFFSKHASEQLHSRSLMTRSDLLSLLDKDLYVPVGLDKNHVHLVIYSIKDDNNFVVVHDEKNLEIITFLPLEYNNKFVIFNEPVKESKKMTLNYFNKSQTKNIQKSKKEIKKENGQFIRFFSQVKQITHTGQYSVIVNNKINDELKEIQLFEINSEEFSNDINNLKTNDFSNRIKKKIEFNFIDPAKIVNIILIHKKTQAKIKICESNLYIP